MSRSMLFRLHFSRLLPLIIMLLFAVGARAAGPESLSLNGSWKFKYLAPKSAEEPAGFEQPGYNDADWAAIAVPGNWNMLGFGTSRYGSPEESLGFYRTRFTVPAEWRGQHAVLRFEGVMYVYELWVNGKRAGAWDSAYNPCEFDVTGLVEYGAANTLAVRVANRSKTYEFDTNDDWSYSGIFRDVELKRVPLVHIAGQRIVTRVAADGTSATVTVATEVGAFDQSEKLGDYQISGELRDAGGQVAGRFERAAAQAGEAMLSLKAPKLWTAETPYLYTLTTTLARGGAAVQTRTERVGVREVSIRDAALRVNGRPVKLRGVDRHESDPILGKALREPQMRRDIELMKAANINFVRTSHYPPHPRFIELCDELGMWVDCEVPFGFGDKHLTDPSYQDALYQRAEATLARDRNHPSIIFWTVGNENPWTEIVANAVRRVKALDPTRPASVALMGGDVSKYGAELAKVCDILCAHYPDAEQIVKWSQTYRMPVVATEYSHALGLSVEQLGPVWRAMESHDTIAGGAVWDWCDQAILKQAEGKTPPAHPEEAWPDKDHYYDCKGNSGTDGIVYADRTPQTDYWQVRKIYAPIQLEGREAALARGARRVRLEVRNAYDFVDLKEIGARYRWRLWRDAREVKSGAGEMALAPHARGTIEIETGALEGADADWRLEIRFENGKGQAINERTLRLLPEGKKADWGRRLAGSGAAEMQLKREGGVDRVATPAMTLERERASGTLTLKAPGGETLLAGGPWARVGRPLALTEQANAKRRNLDYWDPYLLKAPQVTAADAKLAGRDVVMTQTVRYERAGRPGQALQGTITATVSPQGWIELHYELTPEGACGLFLEAGLSLLLPKAMTHARWLGDGPYPALPLQDELDERGIHHLASGDLHFAGARPRVDVLAITDDQGRGIGVIGGGDWLGWEQTEDGIVLSHLARVGGRGNKTNSSMVRIEAAKTGTIRGTLRIAPLAPEHWPGLFGDFFGAARPANVAVFAPFFASYDR